MVVPLLLPPLQLGPPSLLPSPCHSCVLLLRGYIAGQGGYNAGRVFLLYWHSQRRKTVQSQPQWGGAPSE